MDTINKFLDYMLKRLDDNYLIDELEISTFDLRVVVNEILCWVRLEQQRTIWIEQGRKNCLKPLIIDKRYPKFQNICRLVEKEKIFSDCFEIKGNEFNFSSNISEEERIECRKLVYKRYKKVFNS